MGWSIFGNLIRMNGSEYVKHAECPKKHEDLKWTLNQRIEDLKSHFDTRIDDVIRLLKK